MQHALAQVGVAVDDPDELVWCIGPPIIDNFARLGVTGDRAVEAVAAYRERYDRIGAFENAIFPGIPELLDDLARAGRTLAVATSKAEGAVEVILDHFDLRRRFQFVAGASADHSRSIKADVVAYALAGLGHPDPAEVVLVGDRHHDVDGARLSRIASIAVTWGYASDGELGAAAPDHMVDTVEALRAVLL